MDGLRLMMNLRILPQVTAAATALAAAEAEVREAQQVQRREGYELEALQEEVKQLRVLEVGEYGITVDRLFYTTEWMLMPFSHIA